MSSEAGGPIKKAGRPAGKRGTFTFRVTPDLRAKLEASAKQAERPVSEEVEKRLEQSYALESIVAMAAVAAAQAIQRERFGSREIFEAAELYGQILTGLMGRLENEPGQEKGWRSAKDVEAAKSYLKAELAARVDGMVEVFFCDLANKSLEGPDRYETGALAKERSIPREIAGRYLAIQAHKHAIRHKLLPHLMDETGETGSE